jgi:hypothetical protein
MKNIENHIIEQVGIEDKGKYYRFKDGLMVDPYEYYRIHGELPYDRLDEISEDEFLDGSGKTICCNVPFDKFKAIAERRKQELITVPG